MADRLLGSFVWCELMTSDMAAAESFYKTVVGWNAVPFAPDGSYMVFNNRAGDGVAGMMKLPDDAKQMGAPPSWMMYVGTPDVDATAMRIAQLGGRVVKQPASIPDTGRFAIVQDPYGATFGIFQPPPNRPGRGGQIGVGDFSWFELYTPNPEGAWKFYETLFGWEKTSAMDMGEMGVYQMFGRGGGIPSGGIMKPPSSGPASWMPYAMVTDAKAAAAAATAHGGKIVNGPMEVPGGDWIAQGMDPQGAMFSVHSLNPAAGNRQPAAETSAGQPRKAAKKAGKKGAAKKTTASARAATSASKKKAAKKKTAKQPPAKKKSVAKKKAAVKKKTAPKKKAAPKKTAAPKKKAAKRKK